MANTSKSSKAAKRRAKVRNLKATPRNLSATDRKKVKGGIMNPMMGDGSVKPASITDGTSNTILVGEKSVR